MKIMNSTRSTVTAITALLLVAQASLPVAAHAARFLFDADHGQSAANADWVIDADLHNLSWTSAGTFTTASGDESNAQRIPTPPASGIAPTTNETYWSGAISAWAVDLVKRGHSVETLPAGTTLTYNTANSQDLTNYDVVIIDEPNVLFALAEKQALLSFVSNGGSLFMISDHSGSDRNSDNQDSVTIWDDFLTNNLVTNNPFGILFPNDNTSPTNKFYNTTPGDPLLAGPLGIATNIAYFSGNRFQIVNANNPTTTAEMWDGTVGQSNTFCMLARLQYGKGRVVVTGDSSSFDDGSGDPNDTSIINGYTGDLNGTNRIWILNSSEWLATPSVPPGFTTNSWTDGSGKWETGANWSAGAPSLNDSADLLTNAGNNFVTIDGVTTNSPSTMTISNLVIKNNTLFMTNAGVATPLHILHSLTVTNGGSLIVGSSVLQFDGNFGATNFVVDGALSLSGGSILVTNTGAFGVNVGVFVGLNSAGTLSIHGGTMQSGQMDLGVLAGSQGTLLLSGGTLSIIFNGGMNIGLLGTGSVFVTGGQLNALQGMSIGQQAPGQLSVSGGSVRAGSVLIGNRNGGLGTITISGTGSLESSGLLQIGSLQNSTGAVWVTGGSLIATNGGPSLGTIFVGNQTNSFGQMTVSNGTVLARSIIVGTNDHSVGVINIVGGTVIIDSQTIISNGFRLGDSTNSTGSGTVTGGGSLVVTNTTTTIGNNGDGSLTVSNGSAMTGETDLGAGSNSVGNLMIASNGTMNVLSNLTAGSASGSTGMVMMTGGSMTVTNGTVGIGNNGDPNGGTGFGQFTLQNASLTAQNIVLGSSAGGHGSLVVKAGGLVHLPPPSAGCTACGFSHNEGILDGGTIDAPQSTMWAGKVHPGEFIVSNGVARVLQFHVGLDSLGTYTHAGGTVNVFSNLVVGSGAGVTGIVNITGGSLFVTNANNNGTGLIAVGNTGDPTQGTGVGQMTIANASVTANGVVLGSSAGGHGTLAVKAGGIIHIPVQNNCGACGFSANEGILDGGTIDAPGSPFWAGKVHPGEFDVTNGVGTFLSGYIGFDNTGTMNMVGGIVNIYSNMVVGDCSASVTGRVMIMGGTLYVTNAAHNAVLDVRSGSFLMFGGQVVADKLVMTNACALFQRAGGTTTFGSTVLDPNLDADGDGIPNGYEQAHGLDPVNAADANADNDDDGFSNLQEYLAGTDPNNASSTPFRITSIVRSGNDIVLTWTTVGGRINVVQVSGATNYSSTNFVNLSGLMAIPGTNLVSTNYADVGGATNKPSRFYRVKIPASNAVDDTGDPAYSTVWTNGSNGGVGFTPWALITSSGSINQNGFFMASSTNNAFVTGPSIDVAGKSWGMYANSFNTAVAFRGFASSLAVGQSFRVNMDNGFIDPGTTDGFWLRHGNASSSPIDSFAGGRFEFFYRGSDVSNSFKVIDAGGETNIGVGFTGTGLRLVFTLTSANTYTLLTIDNATGATNTWSGTLVGSGTVDSVALYDDNAGSGAAANTFFNSLAITGP